VEQRDLPSHYQPSGKANISISMQAGKTKKRILKINDLEGLWSLLRSWLRPHRGVSQEKLLWY